MNKKEAENILKKISDEIVVEKIIHKGWEEWDKTRDKLKEFDSMLKEKSLFGKYQYIYSSPKGKISLINLNESLLGRRREYQFESGDYWEIYCIEGKLFENVKRFRTKKQAEKIIREILA